MDVVVGRVVKAHGISGELAVEVRTDSPEHRFAPGAVLATQARDGTRGTMTITGVRAHHGRMLVRVAGVEDRDGAEALRGVLLLADTGALPAIEDPDEFYDHQLEGLRAELPDGSAVGTVGEVLHAPSGELLSIDRDGASVLVPFVRTIVPEVDLSAGRLVLDPPEGLLDAE